MIALLLVIAGFCIMLGAKDLAGKFIRAAITLVVVLSLLPVLFASVREWLGSLGNGLDGGEWLIAAALSLGLIGFIAWRTRAWRAARRDALQRRHGAPRDRVLPPPPQPGQEDDQ